MNNILYEDTFIRFETQFEYDGICFFNRIVLNRITIYVVKELIFQTFDFYPFDCQECFQ